MSATRVSVLLASRNGERYLESSLRSIEKQTWDDVEVILVDDGSTDGTRGIMQAFADGRLRTHVLTTPGVGLAGAMHQAAEHATGAYLARQDDDDLSHPERFRKQIDFLDAHADIGVLGTTACIIDSEGSDLGVHAVPMGSAAIRDTLRKGSPFVHGSVMMRRDAYVAAGGYRAAFRASQDYDLWLRMPGATGFANLKERLYSWRLHADSAWGSRREDQIFHAAVARTFADERRRSGSDSIELLGRTSDPGAFIEAYSGRARLLAFLGEAYVREGRTAEARAYLRRAFGGAFPRAIVWWLASFPAALRPKSRWLREREAVQG